MTSTDLAGFLLARIAEEEQNAQPPAKGLNPDAWHSLGCAYDMVEYADPCRCPVPARVLAECAARRAVVLQCSAPDIGDGCTECNMTVYLADDVLRALAQPYSGHPSFDASWLVSD